MEQQLESVSKAAVSSVKTLGPHDDAFRALKTVFALIGCKGPHDTFNEWHVEGTAEQALERLRLFHEAQTDGCSSCWDIPF